MVYSLPWVDQIWYIILLPGDKVVLSLRCKTFFFRSINAIFGKVDRLAPEAPNVVRTKCMPIVLYGLECFSVAQADIKSLDLAVTPFSMKLFRTTNIDVIEECRLFFDFLLPSEMLEIRRAKFECKLINCSNVLNYFRLGLIV